MSWKEPNMANTPDFPLPDSIPTQHPSELPPIALPDETLMPNSPEFETPAPDIYEPGQGETEETGPEPQNI
jgi:hypothetical protein